jgi:hypothetical protein
MKRLLAAILAACSIFMLGAQGAYAADNVDRTSTCTFSLGGTNHVRIHSNWDNTAGNNGAVLDYWSTKTDDMVNYQKFRVSYWDTGRYSPWVEVNMATNGPNNYTIINETYSGVTYVNKWVHNHGYSNRYTVQVYTAWRTYFSDVGWQYYGCTVEQSPYWA